MVESTTAIPEAAERRAFAQLLIAEWRQSWRPGAAALIGTAVSYSVWSAVSSLFVLPLQQEFGWSRGDIAFAHNAGLVSAFSAPLLGRLVDRLGVRPILLCGLALTALCYVALAFMTGSLALYYGLYFLLTIAGMTNTGVTYTRVIAGAFRATRGSALAMTRSGLALSGAILPVLVFAALSRWGIRGGFLTMAGLILLMALPSAWLWIPAQPTTTAPSVPSASVAVAWLRLLRNPKVVLLCVAAALNYAPVVALMTQMMPLALSKGLPADLAVGAVSTIGLAAFGGALVSGLLVDRFWAPAVACVLNAAPAIGCLFLLPHAVSPWTFYAAVIMIGLGQGAEIDIVAFMIGRYFGLKDYATIYGLGVLCIGFSVALAAASIGRAYDWFGNYDLALIGASTSFGLAAVAYLALGRYPNRYPDQE